MATVQTRSAQSGSTPVTVSITTTAGNLLGIVTGAFAGTTSVPSRTGETNNVGQADFADAGTDHLRGDYMMNIGGNANSLTGNGSVTNGTACSVTEFSGRATTSALDVSALNHAVGTATTIQPGSVTPTAGSDLMTGTGDDGSGNSASTISAGWTVDEVGGANTVWDGNTAAIGGSAHLDNAPASATNPTWTTHHTSVAHMAALIMGFLSAGGGGAQDTPELRGRPDGLRGQMQMHQLLAQ